MVSASTYGIANHKKRRPRRLFVKLLQGSVTDVTSHHPRDHHLLDLGDGLGRIQALRAGIRAVHDRVAAIEPERIMQVVEALAGVLVAAVDKPAIGLEQGCGT